MNSASERTTTRAATHWTPAGVLVVGLCFLLNMLDGADIAVMSFIAPVLAKGWQVRPENLGVIFSASLAGMAIGCLLVAPLGDRFGRRAMILSSLGLVAAAMIGSGFANSVSQLMLWRLVVGIGVGTIGVSMTAMAAEFAPAHHASFAVGLVQAGWPVGSIVTGFAVASLVGGRGWQPLLIGIGIMSVVLLLIIAVWLPESKSFLASRQAHRSPMPDHLMARLSPINDAMLPEPPKTPVVLNVVALFQGGRARNSVLLWTAVTFAYFLLYFAISWIPKLAADAGLPLEHAIYAGASYNAGAFVGTTLVAALGIRFRLHRVIALFFGLAVIALLVFGGVRMPVLPTLLVGGCVGIAVQGAFNGFWALAARLYPVAMRGTGIGWALGVGRIGAVLGPIVGGILVGAGWSMAEIFAFYTLPAIVAASLCLFIRDSKHPPA